MSERFDTVINHASLAVVFAELGEPAEAFRHARLAVEHDDEDFRAHFLTGWYAYIGDLENLRLERDVRFSLSPCTLLPAATSA